MVKLELASAQRKLGAWIGPLQKANGAQYIEPDSPVIATESESSYVYFYLVISLELKCLHVIQNENIL